MQEIFNFNSATNDDYGTEYMTFIKRENMLLELPELTQTDIEKLLIQWKGLTKIKRKNKITKLFENILRLRHLKYN